MNSIPIEIVELWQQGRKVEAIKQLCEYSGMGLKDAKDLLETLDESQAAADAKAESIRQLREQMEKLGMKGAGRLLDQLEQGADPGTLRSSSFTSVSTRTINGKTTTTVNASGDKDQAVDMLMSSTGMAHEEAKARIETAMASGNKIEAIKHLRDITGLGLAEAKDQIDAAMQGDAIDWDSLPRHTPTAPSASMNFSHAPGEVPRSQGWFWIVLVLIAVAIGAWFYLKTP